MANGFFNQVKGELTEYSKALGTVGRLRLIGIISRVLGLFLLILTVVLCALALFTFGAVAAIDAMSACMPVWAAALIIGCSYIVLIILAIVCRKPLFVHPFIKLMTKQIKSEEELALKIIEAEHAVDLQNTRMQCQIENATREWDFYVNLFSRLRDLIRKIFRKEK
jgi:membrane protein implicated in regulation of membrane protease activity